MEQKINDFMAQVGAKNPNEPEFLQAVKEFAETVIPFIAENKKYDGKNLLLRIAEPERAVIFRVPWVDDEGKIQVNRGFRIQMNSAIGPYKGGIRFHNSVNLSVLKFLAFEQVFKNSLTALPMGGGKGGSDFDPQGKSDAEVMRFCQSFMTELCRHIGPDLDVPAGDIGVGAREIGYMFGQYKRIRNEFTGVLTGKGLAYGGSLIRPEATGYGVVYFTEQMLKTKGEKIAGKTVAISGFGNVAWGVALKINELGGKLVTISGPDGYIYDADGISGDKIDFMLEMRANGDNRAETYVEKYPNAVFHKGKSPWEAKVDIAIPCATQNELNEEDAKKLEFPYAKYGASGLETVFSALNTFAIEKLSLETIIDKLTNGPKSIFNLPINTINEGVEAELTIFDPSLEWEYKETKSTSKNNPYLGQTLKGKVLGTVVKGEVFMN
jgi:glutamate dehydrogenase (NADP+)